MLLFLAHFIRTVQGEKESTSRLKRSFCIEPDALNTGPDPIISYLAKTVENSVERLLQNPTTCLSKQTRSFGYL